MEQFVRTKMLLGEPAIESLNTACVAVFGLGGVGGACAEALVRAGIGRIEIVDNDKFCLSNLNRQIFATHTTIGQYKTDAAEARLLSINPRLVVTKRNIFFSHETLSLFDFSGYDYVVDAIDSVDSKILLIETAKKCGTPIISAMGAGNKVEPSALMVADIKETGVCPLAKIIRKQLRAKGITDLRVVYSKEPPKTPLALEKTAHRAVIGSTPCVPPAMGLILAAAVINDLCNRTQKSL